MDEVAAAKSSVSLLRMIWLSLLAAVIAYGVITYIVTRNGPPRGALSEELSQPVILALHAIALVEFGLAFLLPNLLFRSGAGAPRELRASSPDAVYVTPQTRVRFIIRWAFIEATAVFGLVCAFIREDPRLFLPLGLLSFVGLLATRPSETALRDMAIR